MFQNYRELKYHFERLDFTPDVNHYKEIATEDMLRLMDEEYYRPINGGEMALDRLVSIFNLPYCEKREEDLQESDYPLFLEFDYSIRLSENVKIYTTYEYKESGCECCGCEVSETPIEVVWINKDGSFSVAVYLNYDKDKEYFSVDTLSRLYTLFEQYKVKK